ncbi:AAA family ATPase, partial [Paenibacillus mendelii]
MRWVGLQVDGFGKLNDFTIDMDAQVTVIYGPNEAGKSTTLGFIRSMLYGFATKANRVERQEPSGGGKHGGRLLFRDTTGRLYAAERYASSSGRISVRMLGHRASETTGIVGSMPTGEGNADARSSSTADDLSVQTLTQAIWERLYLGGVNERVYRQLFAITLTELQAIGMLEGDELGKQLYHAGWSGGGAVAQVEKKLTSQLDGLFRPRGSTQAINRLLKSLDTAEAELRKVEDGITTFQDLTAAIETAETEHAQAESRLPGLRERALLLARACSMHPLWVRRLAMEREQEDLQRSGRLPADARSRWEGLRTELDRLQAEMERLRETDIRTRQRLSQLDPDESLAARGDEIQALVLSSENMEAAARDRLELEAELREHQETIVRLLQRIATNWTEDKLSAFRAGVAEREWIRRSRTDFTDLTNSRSLAEAELRSIRTQLHALSLELAELNHTAEPAWTAEPDPNRGSTEGGFRPQTGVGVSDGSGFELLPASYEALRHAARTFDDAWREWELEQLRAASTAPASLAGAKAVRGGAALWAAAGALAAAAAAMAAAGWHTAAIAAGAASAALALSAALARARA